MIESITWLIYDLSIYIPLINILAKAFFMTSSTFQLNRITTALLVLCVIFTFSNSYAVDVYVTKDKDGNPVFSDQPSANAEKITIEDIQTVPQPQTQPISPSTTNIKELPKYDNLVITSPTNDETIRENTGALTINISLSPELRGNDVISLSMDGKEVSSGRELSYNLSNVDRGSHVLQAAILSPTGKKLIESSSVTVHLQRTSIINNPPAAP